ncbi:MAG: hypothetical protein ACXVPN_09595 [Bacteroidia bacterium]
MKRSLFILFQMAMCFLYAQEDGFTPGYIITNKNETITGRIRDRRYAYDFKASQKIQFKNPNGELEKFRGNDIKGYVKDNVVVYQTLTLGIEEKRRFVRVLENGAVILFAEIGGQIIDKDPTVSQLHLQGGFIYITIGSVTQKRTGDFYLQKNNDPNSLMEWRPRDYKMTAKYFFRENKELVKEIEDEKYGYSDLQTIVKRYNEWKVKQ